MKKLVEIAIFTPDVKRVAEFYRKVLGEKPSYETAESAEFKLGDAKLFIHVKDKINSRADPDFPPGVDHIALGVHDVDKEAVNLQSNGVKADIGPRDFYWGRSAYFRDPDGRLVELHKLE